LTIAAADPAPLSDQAPTGVTIQIPALGGITSADGDGRGLSSTVTILLMMTVLSLAPAIMIMMTCFTRIIIVLAMLRQGLATQQLPPNQVMISLALFMTFVVMAPTWRTVHAEAVSPYLENEISYGEAFERGAAPVRSFMIRQLEACQNQEDIFLFLDDSERGDVSQWKDVPTTAIVPAFMLSELKTAFIMGFRIYLPFLVIDMVIASILISMGMLMLPPVLISLPFKILLFVLVNGWHLVVGSLMDSFV
jgi:flagellar biosynthetic protein FliP